MRLFKATMPITTTTTIIQKWQSIADGSYGSGVAAPVVSAIMGVTGITVIFKNSLTAWPVNWKVYATAYDGSKNKLFTYYGDLQNMYTMTILIPCPGSFSYDINFCSLQLVSPDSKSCAPLQVITTQVSD